MALKAVEGIRFLRFQLMRRFRFGAWTRTDFAFSSDTHYYRVIQVSSLASDFIMVSNRVKRPSLLPVNPQAKPTSGLPSVSASPNISDTERILALQRLIGNHATQALLQRETWFDRRKAKKAARRNDKVKNLQGELEQKGVDNLPWKAAEDKEDDSDWSDSKAESIIGGAEMVATFKDEISLALANFSAENRTRSFDGIYRDWLKEQGLPQNQSMTDLSDDQLSDLEQKEIERGGLSVISQDSKQRDDLGLGSSAAGTVASAAGSISGFVSMAATISKFWRGDEGWIEKTLLALEAGGQGAQGVSMGLQSLAGAGSTIAAGVATMDNDTAGQASEVMSGISDSLGGLTPVIDVFLASMRTVGGVFSFKKATRRERKAIALDASKNALSAAKAFLMVARSTISAAHTFMDIASATSNLVSVVPIIGAVINICIQFVDVIMQLIELVRHAIRVHKGRVRAKAMRARRDKEPEKAPGQRTDEGELYEKLREINSKRMKRAIRPMVAASVSVIADVVSVGGSLLNIIGVATSPAYGAGVAIMAAGYALSAGAGIVKLGASASKPVAGAIRGTKQGARNFAANQNPNGLIKGHLKLKKTREALGHIVDTGKTTKNKHLRDVATTKRLFNLIAKLPAYSEQVKGQYESAYDLLRATGVDRRALFAANGNPARQMEMIIAAIKMRE